MTKKKPAKFPHVMVYLGVRVHGLGLDRKRCFVWSKLKSPSGIVDENDDKLDIFTKPLQKRATPGSVFIMQGDETGANLFVNSGDYLGPYKDEAQATRWWALHHAAESEAETLSKANVKLQRKLDLELLKPLRVAYSRASSFQRGLIIANVVKFITGGVL